MMTFAEAFEKMRSEGAFIKCSTWLGYWAWENDTIMMYTKEGNIMDIRETQDVAYTVKNMLRDDWEIATPENSPVLRYRGKKINFTL